MKKNLFVITIAVFVFIYPSKIYATESHYNVIAETKNNYKQFKDEFVMSNGNVYYYDSNGNMCKWEQIINGKEYYFNGAGIMHTGWLSYANGTTYYFKDNGQKAENEFVKINDYTYYFDSKGQKSLWEQTIDGKEYYFNGAGIMYTGWLSYPNGRKYYFKADGAKAKSEYLTINGKEYLFDDEGKIVTTGWVTVNGNKYFYNSKGEQIGNGVVKKVIDVSEHNGVIDWNTVYEKGDIDAVILRLGYGSEGEDKYFNRNLKEVNRLRIPYSIYLYSYAEDVDGANSEAEFVAATLNKYKVSKSIHIYYDIEKPEYLDGRDVNISTDQYKKIIPSFIKTLNSNGYNSISVYTYRYYLQTKLNDQSLIKYVDWIAEYGSHVNYNGKYSETDFKGWQYSSKESIDGIKGNVDVSVFF